MRFQPHAYQQRAIDHILNEPYVGLFMDMGLGKTVTTLFAIKALRYEMFQIHKVLVIAPKKVAEATWQSEIEKWDGLDMLKVSTILGSAKEREVAATTPADVYIINRDNVQWLAEFFKKKWPYDMVVLDESSSFKNHRAKRFRALKTVRGRINRIVELTGTPAARDYMDLWAQLYLLDAGQRLGYTITQYRDNFFRPDKRNGSVVFSYKLRPGAGEVITDAISDICFSMKAKDYLTLPDMIVNDVPVQLSEDAMKKYKQLQRDYVLALPDDKAIDAGTAAVLRNKLLQVASGSVYDELGDSQFIHDCKLEALSELIEQINEPVLLFYSFKHSIPYIENEMHKMKKSVRMYEGPQDAKDWNEGKIDVLIAHPASCAYGLNLQFGGHHIVWFGLTDSLELYLQANARLHRQGQEKPVFVHRLLCNDTADMMVKAGLEAKDRAQEELLERMKLLIAEVKGERSAKK